MTAMARVFMGAGAIILGAVLSTPGAALDPPPKEPLAR
jgi:hypothetical protein